MTGMLVEERGVISDTHTHRKKAVQREGQRLEHRVHTPRSGNGYRSLQKPGEGCGGDLSRRNWPAATLISDFWSPELGENTFLLSEATPFTATCYSSPGELILGSNVDHVKK